MGPLCVNQRTGPLLLPPLKTYMVSYGVAMATGEQEAWEHLAGLDADRVCIRAAVVFDPGSGVYVLESFGQRICICPAKREISSPSPLGELLITDLGHLSRLSILRYLTDAKDLSPSGEWVKPGNLPGGEIYLKGAHVLPLDRLTETYGGSPEKFLANGRTLGGRRLNYGDAAVALLPLPKIPVAVTLWEADSEFPADTALLLDSTCPFHLPADIIWATAMMTVEMLLRVAD